MVHTPGPWRYDKERCAILVGEDKEDFTDVATNVVNLYGAMGGDDTGADARLMAAAPDLLDALVEIMDGYWHYVEQANEDDEECARLVREMGAKARAAIAKAEGDQRQA